MLLCHHYPFTTNKDLTACCCSATIFHLPPIKISLLVAALPPFSIYHQYRSHCWLLLCHHYPFTTNKDLTAGCCTATIIHLPPIKISLLVAALPPLSIYHQYRSHCWLLLCHHFPFTTNKDLTAGCCSATILHLPPIQISLPVAALPPLSIYHQYRSHCWLLLCHHFPFTTNKDLTAGCCSATIIHLPPIKISLLVAALPPLSIYHQYRSHCWLLLCHHFPFTTNKDLTAGCCSATIIHLPPIKIPLLVAALLSLSIYHQ